jgi:hypothetical protein
MIYETNYNNLNYNNLDYIFYMPEGHHLSLCSLYSGCQSPRPQIIGVGNLFTDIEIAEIPDSRLKKKFDRTIIYP